jgi:hypothetical protein
MNRQGAKNAKEKQEERKRKGNTREEKTKA